MNKQVFVFCLGHKKIFLSFTCIIHLEQLNIADRSCQGHHHTEYIFLILQDPLAKLSSHTESKPVRVPAPAPEPLGRPSMQKKGNIKIVLDYTCTTEFNLYFRSCLNMVFFSGHEIVRNNMYKQFSHFLAVKTVAPMMKKTMRFIKNIPSLRRK